jgi:glucose-6-phosphate isomerase
LLPLLKKIHNSKFAIIVNSKSGTTLEPALGFRLFREQLQKNVGISKLHKYIVAVTDYEKGTLHDFAKHNHITTFGLANDIGGRFSTLTAVGMFLMIVKGLNPLKILQGAKQARKDCESDNLSRNSAYLYACYRHYLYNFRHLSIENFIVYEPCLEFVGKM